MKIRLRSRLLWAMTATGSPRNFALVLGGAATLLVFAGASYGVGRALRSEGAGRSAPVEEPRADPTGCLALAAAMPGCTPGVCRQPHPFVEDFEIEHRIRGEDDGACVYAQTRPGNVEVECRLTSDGREAQAEILDEIGRGVVSAAYFATECAIRRGG